MHLVTKAPAVLHGARGYFNPCSAAGTRVVSSLARSRGPSQACEGNPCLKAVAMWICIYSSSPWFPKMRFTSWTEHWSTTCFNKVSTPTTEDYIEASFSDTIRGSLHVERLLGSSTRLELSEMCGVRNGKHEEAHKMRLEWKE